MQCNELTNKRGLLRTELPWMSMTSLHPAGVLGIRAHVRWTAGPAPTINPLCVILYHRYHHIEKHSMTARESLDIAFVQKDFYLMSSKERVMGSSVFCWGSSPPRDHVRFISSTHTLG